MTALSDLAFSRRIAMRYLLTRRGDAFIRIVSISSILGVAIGVMVLVIVMAVMTGFEFELREKIFGADSHVLVRALSGRLEHWREKEKSLLTIPGVSSVSPFTVHQALIRTESSTAGLLIRGIAEGSESARQVEKYLEGLSLGELFSPAPIHNVGEVVEADEVHLPGILIGREMARTYGVLPGSVVSILSSKVASSPFGLIPKYKRFVVVGTYASGLSGYESTLAYVALPEAQRFFGMADAVSGLEVRLSDANMAPEMARQILEDLGGINAGITAQDWTEMNRPFWEAIKLEKRVYFIVLLLIIVMASFSIVSTLVMLVLEKRRDIAVLRTLGASRGSIANIFRLQGAIIGLCGVLLGLIAGYGSCLALRAYGFPIDDRVFPVSTLPVRIEPFNFFIVGVCAFAICLVATVYPARRAGSLQPAEVLRYE